MSRSTVRAVLLRLTARLPKVVVLPLAGLLPLASLLLPNAVAAPPVPAAPATVVAKMAALDRTCRAAGGTPERQTYVFVQDFTGDGRLDFLVSEGNYACSGRADLFRKDGQAAVEIYVVDERGQAAPVWRQTLLAYRILDQRPRIVQIAQVGLVCGPGSTASTKCGATLRWNPDSRRFDSVPTGARPGQEAAAAAPAGAATTSRATPGTAPDTSTAPPIEVKEDLARFAERCRGELVRRNPAAAKWADSECKDRWDRVVAAGPMIDSILGLVPERAGIALSAAAVKARLKDVRWRSKPAGKTLATGALGPLAVEARGGATVKEVSFGWSETGVLPPYEAIEALKVRGITPVMVGCMALGAGETTEVLRVAAPGRAPFALTVYSRTAPTANAWSTYNATADLSGKIPTLASLRAADRGGEWTTACPD